ncbi:MAG TPA: hypothetical protein VJT73_20245 [Polyangiaceae bacterium]|nr:hypothetical protein [Polyangiaceae bacterium]
MKLGVAAREIAYLVSAALNIKGERYLEDAIAHLGEIVPQHTIQPTLV